MATKIIMNVSAFSLTLLLALGVVVSSVSAHDGEDHSVVVDAHEMEKMEKMVSILTQIVELYKKKAALAGVVIKDDHHHETAATHDDESDELEVWVELHSNKTHAHVKQSGKEEQSWLFEDIAYTEEAALIKAIAEKSGLSEHDIEKVIVFPSGEVDEKGDSVVDHGGHDDDAGHDVAGIHIMSDGTVMWGNGDEVHGATITADGKIKLSDGTIVEPKFDLR